jgi:DNA-binding transcriptional ArsR family regulator
MLEPILGSVVREQVLIFIHINVEGYAREISRFFKAPLDSVQKQLKRLEEGSVLQSKRKGRTVIYSFNTEYPYLNELRGLLERVRCMHTQASDAGRIKVRRRRAPVIVKGYRKW